MLQKLKKVKYLHPNIAYFPLLQKHIAHGFSWGKQAGNMQFSFGDPVEVRMNVQKFLEKLDMGDIKESVNMITELSDRIADIDEKLVESLKKHRFGRSVKCDAFFTNLQDITLMAKPGDCTTAIIYAHCREGSEVIGIVHTGRLSAGKELPRKAVKHLVKKYKCKITNIKVAILPHLHKENRRFAHLDTFKNLKVWDGFIDKKDDYYYVSEEGLVISQYLDMGILRKNMQIYDIDTFVSAKQGETFSHKYHYEMEQEGKKVPIGRYIVGVKRR